MVAYAVPWLFVAYVKRGIEKQASLKLINKRDIHMDIMILVYKHIKVHSFSTHKD